MNDPEATVAPADLPRLGKYRIVRLLGEGGMGRVYLAWDEDLREHVAVKVIKPEFLADPAAEERFKRELSIARRISHRNVLRIHDMGVAAEGTRFISMAYVDGDNLQTRLASRPLSRGEFNGIIRDICEGLGSAHDAGVVHRDLKPANVMIGGDGRAYIMDFGLARAGATSATLTSTGAIFGTVDYMSPEQARGNPADQRSDIFALGVMMFEMVTGALPFAGENAVARLAARVTQPAPDVRTLKTDVSPQIAKAIARCLAIDPGARYQSTSALLTDLEPAVPAWRPSPAAAVFVLGLIAAIGGVMFLVLPGGQRRSDPVPSLPAIAAALPFHNSTGDAANDWYGEAFADAIREELRHRGIRVMPRARITQIIGDLNREPGAIETNRVTQRLFDFGQAALVLAGEYSSGGRPWRVVTKIYGNPTESTASEIMAGPDDIPGTVRQVVDQLCQRIRCSEVQESPASPPANAVRAYHEGIGLALLQANSEAAQRFRAAVQLDEGFAPAWAGLARAYRATQQQTEAATASKRAVDLVSTVSPLEGAQIRALHATISGNPTDAIAAYSELLRHASHDADAQQALATQYEGTGQFELARRHFETLTAEDSGNVDALLGLGRVDIRRGHPELAIEPLTRALSIAVRLDSDLHRASALQALGVAYKRLNRFRDALPAYEQALEIRERLKFSPGIAASLDEIAQVKAALGLPEEAQLASRRALAVRRQIADHAGTANTLITTGTFVEATDPRQSIELYEEALGIYRTLKNADGEALALNNIGDVRIQLGDLTGATVFLDRALDIRRRLNQRDGTTLPLQNLAYIALLTGEFERAIEIAGQGIEAARASARAGAEAFSEIQVAEARHGLGDLRDASMIAERAVANMGLENFSWTPIVVAAARAADAALGRCEGSSPSAPAAAPLDVKVRVAIDLARSALWCGDVARARTALDPFASPSSPAAIPERLQVELGFARIDNAADRNADALTRASTVAATAEKFGLRVLGTEAWLEVGVAALQQRQFAAARAAAERSLNLAQPMKAKVAITRGAYVLALALRGLGRTAEADRHLRDAWQGATEIRQTAGDSIARRADLRPIFDSMGQQGR